MAISENADGPPLKAQYYAYPIMIDRAEDIIRERVLSLASDYYAVFVDIPLSEGVPGEYVSAFKHEEMGSVLRIEPHPELGERMVLNIKFLERIAQTINERRDSPDYPSRKWLTK
jgi:hypothetical protein